MTARKKSALEWLGIITAVLGLVVSFTAAAKWKVKTDESTSSVSTMVWDIQQMKITFNLAFPKQYDSALAIQIRLNGPRPEINGDP